MKQKKFFALFIGINGYTKCNPLTGCINDVLATKSYFEAFCKTNQFEAVFSYLLAPADPVEEAIITESSIDYKSPTRANVIAGVESLFETADPTRGDCCLLYYSGHGSTLRAPEEFSINEPTGLLQTLVCINSIDNGERDYLIDKELGYLIAKGLAGKAFDPDNLEKPGVQFVAIMDCCFSGSNLRGGSRRKLQTKTTPGKNTPLAATDILGYDPNGNAFYKPITNGKVALSGLMYARHISLAASRDHEPASETLLLDQLSETEDSTPGWKQYGVFTYGLLRALCRSKGSISYLDLIRRIELELYNEGFQQRPQHWALPDTSDEDRSFFKAKMIKPEDGKFQVTFREDNILGEIWSINAGKIHGISLAQKPVFTLEEDSGRKLEVIEVYTSHSILKAEAFSVEDRNKTLRAKLISLSFAPMRVGFDASLAESWRQQIKAAYQKFFKNKLSYYELVEGHSETATFWIKLALDDKKRVSLMVVDAMGDVPLFVPATNEYILVDNLNKVAKWRNTLTLANPVDADRYRNQIDIEVQVLEGVRIHASNLGAFEEAEWKRKEINPTELNLRYINDIKPKLKVKIKPSKVSSSSYYVGAMYLDDQFGIKSDAAPVQKLGLIGETPELWVNGNQNDSTQISRIFDVELKPFCHEYGVTEITDYIMVFVSNEPFNLDQFKQKGIDIISKSSSSSPIDDDIDDQIWFTITIPIHVQYPLPPTLTREDRITLVTRKIKQEETGAARGVLAIHPVPGFNAQIQVYSPDQVKAANPVQGILKSISANDTDRRLLSPTELWIGANTAKNPFCHGILGSFDSQLSILDFIGKVKGGDKITYEKPLIITPGDLLQNPFSQKDPAFWGSSKLDQELVIPYGLINPDATDAEFYVPLGFTDAKGNINLAQMPNFSIQTLNLNLPEKERSVGTAVRAFFQKLIWSRLSGRYEYNTLTMHQKDVEPVFYRSNVPRYAEAKEKIKTELSKAKKVLLLIHGIIGETDTIINPMMEHPEMIKDFDVILTFDYENLDTKIEETAKNLKSMLLECGLPPEKKLSIVAHSMGGLVSRWWIEKEEGTDYVHKLIQAGTPNAGSDIATFRQKILTILTLGINAVPRFRPYLAPLSYLTGGLGSRLFTTLDQMQPGSAFLQQLNSSNTPSVPYYLVAGDTTHIEAIFTDDDPIWKKIWRCINDRTLYIFADKIIFDENANDMAVRVESMKTLPWKHTKVMDVACDHLSYFSNEQSVEKLTELIKL